VNIGKRIFPSEASALRPRLACEITSAGVVAARPGAGDSEIVSSFAPLRPGIFSAGLKSPNFHDRAAVSSAVRQALDEVRLRETKTTVVVPDAAVRVLLLDFDSLPPKTAEALPVIRFRLRKLVPFEVEDAAVSYQIIPSNDSKDSLVRTIVAVCPAAVLAEYESAVREAGYEPGAVLPSTLAALAAVNAEDSALIVNRNATTVTTAITRQNALLLHRTLELTEKDLLPDENERLTIEEMQQSISVAIAYFEDSLAALPRQLLACGMGGAEELGHLLGDIAIPARDLVPAPETGNLSSIPAGMLAGVVGALAS
jgi:type IV pilus assembly protein PilM